MKRALRQISWTSLILASFGFIGTLLIAGTEAITHERIAENHRQLLLKSLHTLVPKERMDNDPYRDKILIQAASLSKNPTPVYRVRKEGKPVAVILSPVAPDGYSGSITLLVGIYLDGTLAGVRVSSHRETPGLGDGIESQRSDWILGFNGKSLHNPTQKGWAVKRDNGQFDQFTGATITPRAVVKAVYKTLLYFQTHQEMLFNTPTATATATAGNDHE
ncbi:MAG: electron transport complex subunit RsxG [Gammaproteobacteria bacterium]|nr:electron transport complex subunit RsxG [Gammaproteobacteria bacterium]